MSGLVPQLSAPNQVTIFSNGMGHFLRRVLVKPGEPQKITIPFPNEYLSDAVTSLNVYGKVKMVVPPSYMPVNANNSTLNLSPQDSYINMLKTLHGNEVEVSWLSKNGLYKLVGVEQTKRCSTNGETFTKDYVVLRDKTTNVNTRVPIDDITGIRFIDDNINSEIDKSLRQSFQKIKRDSAFVEVVLASQDDQAQEATLSFTIPVSVSKMRYSINQRGNSFTLEGAVVVDNNTDEDWKDCIISVVTGDPNAFEMEDYANVVVPRRKKVKLIEGDIIGNVDVSESYPADDQYSFHQSASGSGNLENLRAAPALAAAYKRSAVASSYMNPKSSIANYANFGMEAQQDADFDLGDLAAADGVEARDVGDFCIFTSKTPISIASKMSAVVPMFVVPLATAGVVCFYKESRHPRRPFRAIKFKNDSKFTLGRGKVVIYTDNLFSGECILETAKPGENRMLPHCLENGLKIIKEPGEANVVLISAKISDNAVLQEHLRLASTKYVIENKKDETFKVALEHSYVLGAKANSQFAGLKPDETEKITNGERLYFSVKPHESLTLTVSEQLVQANSVRIGNSVHWIQQNLFGQTDFERNDSVKECMDVQKKIDKVNKQIEEVNNRREKLESQMERARKSLEALSGRVDSTKEWSDSLSADDKEIRKIDDTTLPELEKQLNDLNEKLTNLVSKLSLSWKSPTYAAVAETPQQ